MVGLAASASGRCSKYTNLARVPPTSIPKILPIQTSRFWSAGFWPSVVLFVVLDCGDDANVLSSVLCRSILSHGQYDRLAAADGNSPIRDRISSIPYLTMSSMLCFTVSMKLEEWRNFAD